MREYCMHTYHGKPCDEVPPPEPVEPEPPPPEECCPEPVCCPVNVTVNCTQAEECPADSDTPVSAAESTNGEPIPPGSGGGLKQLQGQTVNITCAPESSACKECVDDPRQLGMESRVHSSIREKLTYCEDIEASGPVTGPSAPITEPAILTCDRVWCGVKRPE